MGQPLPPKKEVVLALLERATVFVHVDPRRQGCVVPMNFKQQPQLVLQVGLNMAVPIPDLRVEDDGITCTLSFGGRGFWCSMPWSCVYAMVGEDGRGMVWPDDLPPEVRAAAAGAAPPPKKPALAEAPPPAAEAPAKAKKPRSKPAPAADAADAKPKAKRARAEAADGSPKKPARARRPKKDAEPPPPPEADIRQRLVALKPAAEPKPAPAPAPMAAPAARESTPSPETPAPVGQRKPKRELPPYLRVVK